MNNEELCREIKSGAFSMQVADCERNIRIQFEKLQQENKQLEERINKAIEYIRSNDIEVLKYHDIPSETTSYEIVTIDLLKILKGGEMNKEKVKESD